MNSRRKEQFVRAILFIFALSSLLFLTGIVLVLFREGLPIFQKVGLMDFIFGREWYPTYDPPDFGILPLICGSLLVTAGAMAISVPVGVASAIFISCILPGHLKNIIKPVVELLAAIPSVIFGLFGLKILGPFLMNIFGLPTGSTALNASIMLGIMALPTIVSISEDAISAVPLRFRHASLALGSTRWEMIKNITVPAATSGIVTAIILGVSRAIGETMTVLMVAGGAAVIPKSILKPVRPMTATIAAEMGEAPVGGDHYHALFGIAIILFFITLFFNIIADISSRKFKEKVGA